MCLCGAGEVNDPAGVSVHDHAEKSKPCLFSNYFRKTPRIWGTLFHDFFRSKVVHTRAFTYSHSTVTAHGAGGAPLHGMVLTEDMFAATEMVAGGEVAFEAMKVDQLKAELAERGSTRSGRKAILQRRLHALLVQAAIERCGGNMDV